MYINSKDVDSKRRENNFDFLESLASINDPVKEDVTLTHSFLVMSGGNKLIARDKVTDNSSDGILTSKEISQLDLNGLDLLVRLVLVRFHQVKAYSAYKEDSRMLVQKLFL